MSRVISFSPPDITEEEINEVIDALKSGWITTGPKTKLLEKKLAEYVGTDKLICLNSATAALELALILLEIKSEDEVIVPAYTYTASASIINHVGAKIVMVDVEEGTYHFDYEKLEKAITPKTKVIIPVDLAGTPCDYDKIFDIVNRRRSLFEPNGDIQAAIGRVIILADAAHAIGAKYCDKMIGNVADFTAFSFHAVKNFTTAEGGALTWRNVDKIDSEEIYKKVNMLSLHGQTKDALAKTKLGSWEYDIVTPAYKCNMTDIMAGIGLAQLKRYNSLLDRRKEIVKKYMDGLQDLDLNFMEYKCDKFESSYHLFLVRITGYSESERNLFIERMAEKGVACNVHYKPLPMLTAYKNLGFNIEDYHNAYNQYKNEVTLPLHTLLTDDDIEYIIKSFKECLRK